MPVSQNGYSANDRSVIASLTVPGTARKIALRKGDTSVILLDVMAWIHAHVEPIDTGVFDDWGYAERKIRGSATELSNHASGTAVDANATQHPLGVRGTWTADERRRINARLALYEGCVRWGDNYSGRVDGMHFEIDKGGAACRAVADKIRAGRLGGAPAATTKPAATPAKKKVEPMLHVEKLSKGDNYVRIPAMVGTTSALYGRAWVSVSGQSGGRLTVLFQKNTGTDGAPNGSGAKWEETFRNGERKWRSIPAGTDFLECWVTVGGTDGFVVAEFEPK